VLKLALFQRQRVCQSEINMLKLLMLVGAHCCSQKTLPVEHLDRPILPRLYATYANASILENVSFVSLWDICGGDSGAAIDIYMCNV
jgi:hypothetical protein